MNTNLFARPARIAARYPKLLIENLTKPPMTQPIQLRRPGNTRRQVNVGDKTRPGVNLKTPIPDKTSTRAHMTQKYSAIRTGIGVQKSQSSHHPTKPERMFPTKPDTSHTGTLSSPGDWRIYNARTKCCYPTWNVRILNRTPIIISKKNPTATYNCHKDININGNHRHGNCNNGWMLNGATHMNTQPHQHQG